MRSTPRLEEISNSPLHARELAAIEQTLAEIRRIRVEKAWNSRERFKMKPGDQVIVKLWFGEEIVGKLVREELLTSGKRAVVQSHVELLKADAHWSLATGDFQR